MRKPSSFFGSRRRKISCRSMESMNGSANATRAACANADLIKFNGRGCGLTERPRGRSCFQRIGVDIVAWGKRAHYMQGSSSCAMQTRCFVATVLGYGDFLRKIDILNRVQQFDAF